MRILVVGGGLSGIAAAIHLKNAGQEVVLLEAKRRLGGRVGSFWDEGSQQWVDYCQHVGMRCCTHLIWFLEQLGQIDDWEQQKILHFVSRSGDPIPIRPLPLPAPFHLANLLARWPGLSYWDRACVGTILFRMMRLPSVRSGDLDWRGRLAIEWLREKGQSEAAIQNFWGTILTSALGETMDRVLLGDSHKVLMDGFAGSADGYELLVPKRPLSECIDQDSTKKLQGMGVEVRRQSPVQRLLVSDGKVTGVVLGNGETLRGDHIVVSLPWHSSSELFRASATSEVGNPLAGAFLDFAEGAEEIESSPITGVHTWWSRPWLKSQHAILIDRLCQWVFPGPIVNSASEGSGEGKEYYYQVVISGSRSLPKGDRENIVRAVVKELQELFPEARESQFLRGKVVTDPHAVFSLKQTDHDSTNPVRDANKTLRRPATNHFVGSHLWLAGDWTDTKWPATMEGAIRSGWNAASGILEQDRSPIEDQKKSRLASWLIKYREQRSC